MTERRRTDTVTVSAKIPPDIRRELNDYVLSKDDHYLSDFIGQLVVEAWETYREEHDIDLSG